MLCKIILILILSINLIYIECVIKKSDNLFLKAHLNIESNDYIKITSYIQSDFLQLINKYNLTDIFFSLNKYQTKIEKIFIIISIIPFLKRKIIMKHKSNILYDLCQFLHKKRDGICIISKDDFAYIIENFQYLVYYDWEFIPKKKAIYYLRYIINNYYYNETCLKLFDKALNYNFNNYIKKKKKNFTYKDLSSLMSKFYLYL